MLEPTPRTPHLPDLLRPQAVIYTRVSSKEQERGGYSIPAQQDLLRRYAHERGFSLIDEFSDVETAGRSGRTAFGAMIRHIRANPICRAILVEKTDRLYRNLKDWVTLDELDVEIHLVKEHVVLSQESVSSEKFVHGIKVLVAKNFIDNLSEETRKGQMEKARQGHWPARAPLGYRNTMGPDGKRIIEPDPERAHHVAQVFEWYATGNYSVTAITAKAAAAGLVTRDSRKPLPRSMVHAILRNPIYMGEFDWKGVRYPGAHQPLVSKTLWEDVQSVLSGRAPKRRGRQRHRFTFSGLVQCGVCADEGGRFMLVAEIQKKRYVYYRCEECKRRGRATYIREERIDEAYIDALEKLVVGPDILVELNQISAEGEFEVDDDRANRLLRLQAEQQNIRLRLDIAYDDRLAGRIDAPYFDGRAAQWRQRLCAIGDEIDTLEVAESIARTDGEKKLELPQLSVLYSELEDPLAKRRFIATLRSNSTWKGESLVVKWRKPTE